MSQALCCNLRPKGKRQKKMQKPKRDEGKKMMQCTMANLDCVVRSAVAIRYFAMSPSIFISTLRQSSSLWQAITYCL